MEKWITNTKKKPPLNTMVLVSLHLEGGTHIDDDGNPYEQHDIRQTSLGFRTRGCWHVMLRENGLSDEEVFIQIYDNEEPYDFNPLILGWMPMPETLNN